MLLAEIGKHKVNNFILKVHLKVFGSDKPQKLTTIELFFFQFDVLRPLAITHVCY